ncbi:MAG: CpXC domain-containing protein [Aggregatilineales bacterium]
MPANATPITCPNCRQPFSAVIEQLIDVSRDPQGKARLLSGRLNVVTCPHCGAQTALATPIAYHDLDKQLLMIYVPMELGLPKQEQERLIGNFTKAITNSLPPEKRKAYLFTPKMALTQQGMIETILQADGITPEMIAAQREKMRLMETFLQTDPAQYPELVKQRDAELDTEFFGLMLAAAENAAAGGRRDVAEAVLQVRDQLIQLSTVGQQALADGAAQQTVIDDVAQAFEALGERPKRAQVLDLVLKLAADEQNGDQNLQIAVGLARPAMDYEFLQLLSRRIDKAKGDHKAKLEAVRKRLLDLISVIDKQNEAVVHRATETLNAVLNAPDLDQAINEHLNEFDDLFMQVLSYNVQAAEQAKDIGLAARLKSIFEKIVAAIQANAPPELQFVSELLNQPSFEAAQSQIHEHAAQYGPALLQWIDVLANDVAGQEVGNGTVTLDQLGRLRDEIERTLANAPAAQPVAASSASVPAAAAPSPVPASPSESDQSGAPKLQILRGGKYTPLRPK